MKKISIAAIPAFFAVLLCSLTFFSCSHMINDFENMKTESPYTVKFYFEDVDTVGKYIQGDAALGQPVQKTLVGTIGVETGFVPDSIAGFDASVVEDKKIAVDGSTVIEVHYTRKVIYVTFDAKGGYWAYTNGAAMIKGEKDSGSDEFKGRYGTTLTYPDNPVKSNWTFAGWDHDTLMTYPAEDITLNAEWSQSGANYRVNHYIENLDDSDYSLYRFQIMAGAIPVTAEDGTVTRYVTKATALSIPGYSIKLSSGSGDEEDSSLVGDNGIKQKYIEADGSTVVDLYYDRETIDLTFDACGGVWNAGTAGEASLNTISGKYGYEVPELDTSKLTRDDYVFDGWSDEIPSTFPLYDKTFEAQWKLVNAQYSVKYFFENADDTNFTEDVSKKVTSKGKIGESTAATAPEYTGYTAMTKSADGSYVAFNAESDQKTIEEDGSTCVEVYYKRNSVTLTFTFSDSETGGSWETNAEDSSYSETKKSYSVTGKYGQSLDASGQQTKYKDEITVSGNIWTFIGWKVNDTESHVITPVTFPLESTTYTAYYAQTVASYKINYYEQNIDDDDYTLKDYLTMKGEIGNDTAAVAETRSGFTAQAFDQEEIKSDGSTEVNIYYNRNIVTVTFSANGGKWSDGDTEKLVENKKYGAALSVPDADKLTYSTSSADYTLTGWEPDVPSTVPAEDTTYKAQWELQNAMYTVKTYKGQIDSSSGKESMQLISSVVKKGQLGAKTTITADTIDGYEAPVISQAVITADGSAIVTVQYHLKTISYTYKVNGGMWTSNKSTADKVISGYYGATTSVPGSSDISREDYSFDGWDPEVPVSYGTEDKSFTAKWIQVNAAYTVNHYKQNLDGSYSTTPFKTETLKGEISSSTNAKAVSSDDCKGFTVQTIEQQTVKADGSTVVSIYYNRNTVTLTLDPNEGIWNDTGTDTTKKLSGLYEDTVPDYGSVIRSDYVFSGWDPVIPSTYPATSTVYTAQWYHVGTTYTVRYWFESTVSGTTVNGNMYNADEDYTVLISANAGETTQAVPLTNAPAGYTCQTIEQKTVNATNNLINAGDASKEYYLSDTVVDVYYNLNKVTLTFDPSGGSWTSADGSGTDVKTCSGKYGTSVTVPFTASPERKNYKFEGWTVDGTSASVDSKYSTSKTYTAKWTQTAADYTIKFYYENIEDDDYTEDTSKEVSASGTLNAKTTITSSDYAAPEGFETAVVTNTTIVADGSAVVTVKYARKRITFTLDPNGGYWTKVKATDPEDKSDTAVKTSSGKYGANFSLENTLGLNNPEMESSGEDEYSFGGWCLTKDDSSTKESISSTYDETKTYYALWVQTSATYQVIHKLQNVTLDDYDPATSDNAIYGGTVGELTTAVAKNYAGFTAQTIVQQTIEADGSTVVEVKYDRNDVTLTFNGNGGTWSDSSTTKTVTGKYGTTVTAPENPARSGYEFTGWTPTVASVFPAATVTYTAQWNQTEAAFTIKTYVEQTDGTTVLESTTTSTGTIGATTSVTADSRTGYSTPSITQATILADGSAVVTVTYNLKTVTYTFDGNGGTWSVTNTVSGKYGTAFTPPDTSNLTRDGYVFYGWTENNASVTIPSTFETETDRTFKAVWCSSITGVGGNPAAKDIIVTTSTSDTTATLSVTEPYTGSWTFAWYVDGKSTSYTSQSVTLSLTSGKHTIIVEATENEVVTYTKTVTISID